MNNIIIDNFKKLIRLTEIDIDNNHDLQINKFRLNSFKRIVKIVSNLNFEITSINQIKDIPGVGKKTIERIDEILKTNTLKELHNYDIIIKKYYHIYKIINELMTIIGIGRKNAIDLINKYNIKSIEHLKNLVAENKIIINDKIKLGLNYLGKFEGAIPRSEITSINIYLDHLTKQFNDELFITICGSYRRNLKISSDIDVLLCNYNYITLDQIEYNNILKDYINFLHKNEFIIEDITNKNYNTKYMGFCRLNKKKKIRRIDIRYVPLVSYIPALMYFTGSFEFNRNMRQNAKKLGYKLNEYGLFTIKDSKFILILSEQEMFDKLNMKYLSPSER